MTDTAAEARRTRSAALFNNSYFVEVVNAAATLAPRAEDFVTTRKVAAATGLADSLVRPVMLRLVGAGLLRPLPRLAGPRGEQHFAREGTAEWSGLLTLTRALSGGAGPPGSATTGKRADRATRRTPPGRG